MRRVLGWFLVLALLGGGALAWVLWRSVAEPITRFTEESRLLYIPTGADLDQVVDSLRAIDALGEEQVFRLLAERGTLRPGRYRVRKGTSARGLVRMLHAGEQEPVRVTFTNIDHLPELAGRIAACLEPDSLAFLEAFNDPTLQSEVGLSPETMIALFIPDTYEFWWTTTPERFVARMRKEHDAFWSQERSQRARSMGLSPVEVATLASIVQAETVQAGDARRIAGVYLNRLRINMPLQADPTLKFALGLDTVRRLLNVDKEVDSPYNTYTRTGLPPGPINMPEPRFIDAVLNAEQHDYYYFCARADLSGWSEFARTYEQHLVNARKYQKALNARGIYR
jgi:UPF0755 protein